MAYPTVDKPYGLKPVNLIGGQVLLAQLVKWKLQVAMLQAFFTAT